jgi:prepilin-type processing-associated H-X9-DG protein
MEEGSLSALAGAATEDPEYVDRANPFDVWDMQDKGTRTWRPFHESVSSTMTCPSSGTQGALVPFNDDDDGSSGTALAHLSKANYVACFGGNTMLNAISPGSEGSLAPQTNPDPGFAGIFGMARIRKNPAGARVGQGIKIAKVTDGMSKTVMLSEILTWNETNEQGAAVETSGVGQGNDDWRGAWMVPGMGASAFSGKFPPNSTGMQPDFRRENPINSADTIPACGTQLDVAKNPGGGHPDAADIPCIERADSANTWASARSKHNEGVNAAMGDGSVQFIADDIDAFAWHAMCTRAGEDTANK